MKFPAKQKHFLYAQLAKLIHAGFPIEKALKSLSEQSLAPGARQFIVATAGGIASGKTIAASVAEAPELPISEVEKNLIDAGERGGQLAEAFSQLSHYFGKVHTSRKTILRHLVYPLTLLHLAVLLSHLPQFFIEGRHPIRSLAITLGLFYALILLGVVSFRWVQRQGSEHRHWDALLNRLPIVGPLRRSLSMERFCQVFRIYLLSAFRPSEAILAAAEASQSGVLRASARAISPQLAAGSQLGPLLKIGHDYRDDFVTGMSTAEESGTLDKELLQWSESYGYDAEEAFQRIQSWLPKIAYAVAVCFVVYMILQAAFGYMNTVSSLLKE